jgi:hypothetical protein
MDYDKIIIKESKDKKRIVRSKAALIKLLDAFYMLMLIGVFPFIATVDIYRNSTTLHSLTFFVIAVSFFLLILYAILNIGNLKEIKGKNKEENRKLITKIIEQHDWKIYKTNSDILVGFKEWGWFSLDWGKEIVILYSGPDLLINCICYGRYGLKSPFHWFLCRKLERQIMEQFQIELNNTSLESQVNDR